MFDDLQDDEEALLPLPEHWIRSFNVLGENVVYKNIRMGLESEEHPLVLQAINAARKRSLPDGWSVKEALLSDGSLDYFYCNPSLGLSNWDHPHTRVCLAEILLSENHSKIARLIYRGDVTIPPDSTKKNANQDDHQNSKKYGPQLSIDDAYRRFRQESTTVEKHNDHEVKVLKTDALEFSHHFDSKQQKIEKMDGNEEYSVSGAADEKQSDNDFQMVYDINFQRLRCDDDSVNDDAPVVEKHCVEPFLPVKTLDYTEKQPNIQRPIAVPSFNLVRANIGDFSDEYDEEYGPDSCRVAGEEPTRGATQPNRGNVVLGARFEDVDAEEHGDDFEWIASSQYNQSEMVVDNTEELDYPRQQDISQMWWDLSRNCDNHDREGEQNRKVQEAQDVRCDSEEREGEHMVDEVEGEVHKRAQYHWKAQHMTNIVCEARSRSEKWELIRLASEKTFHYEPNSRMRPPLNKTGIKVLSIDVKFANDRVHDLLLQLRIKLAHRSRIHCRPLLIHPSTRSQPFDQAVGDLTSQNDDYVVKQMDDHEQKLATLATDVVDATRRHPELIIVALANSDPGSLRLMNIAFIALHRLLHPYSTDLSHTTALLLEAINYQVDETSKISDLFMGSNLNVKHIMARALFIADPSTALEWNPLGQPLPVVPNVPSETVLTCLLKSYSIRRDVTSFFKAAWKLALPGIATAMSNENDCDCQMFSNLFAVSMRLLECTLRPTVIAVFPAPATAVCRALFEICGRQAAIHYVFNLLILPNILKVIAVGDYDSLDGERIFRDHALDDFFSRQFDMNLWWPEEGFDNCSFDACNSFVWLCWRLYSAASEVDRTVLAGLTVLDFFRGGPRLDYSGVTDSKLRNSILRLSRKVEIAFDRLLESVPLDSHGSEFLKLDPKSSCREMQQQFGMSLTKRFMSLISKPPEMLSIVVVSRFELSSIFADIGTSIEASGRPEDSSLLTSILEYLTLNENLSEASVEHLLLLPCSNEAVSDEKEHSCNSSSDDHCEVSPVSISLSFRFEQLFKGLAVMEKYESTILCLIKRVDADLETSVFDFLVDDKENAHDGHVPQPSALKHTISSKRKQNETNYGLERSMKIPISKRPYDWEHMSLNEKNKDFMASLRFGSSSPHFTVGTSMGREKCLPAKILPSKSGTVTFTEEALGMAKSRARYTKFDASILDSNFLSITESVRRGKAGATKIPNSLKDNDDAYINSLRIRAVIPTDEFLQRKRKNKSRFSLVDASVIRPSRNGDQSLVPSAARMSAPKPFPEHLRHRIRAEEYSEGLSASGSAGPSFQTRLSNRFGHSLFGDLDEMKTKERLQRRLSARQNFNSIDEGDETRNWEADGSKLKSMDAYDGGVDEDRSDEDIDDDDQSQEIASLIRDYQFVFAPAHKLPILCERNKAEPRSKQWTDLAGRYDVDRSESIEHFSSSHLENEHSENRNRNRCGSKLSIGNRPLSPALPEPIPGTNFFAPTKSLLNKLASEQNDNAFKNKFFRDIHCGTLPGLRESTRDFQREKHEIAAAAEARDSKGFLTARSAHFDGKEFSSANRRDLSDSPPWRPSGQSIFPISPCRQIGQKTFVSALSKTNEGSNAANDQTREFVGADIHKTEREERVHEPDRDIRMGDYSAKCFLKSSDIFERGDGRTASQLSKKGENQRLDEGSPGRDLTQLSSLSSSIEFRDKEETIWNVADIYDPKSSGPMDLMTCKYVGSIQNDTIVSSKEKELQKSPDLVGKTYNFNKMELVTALCKGFTVVKHSRSGGPKEKFFRYDSDADCLIWTATKISLLLSLASGKKFSSSMEISSIIEVRRGLQTPGLIKHKLLDPSCCVSVISSERHLDLQFKTAGERNKVIRALQGILDGKQPVRYL